MEKRGNFVAGKIIGCRLVIKLAANLMTATYQFAVFSPFLGLIVAHKCISHGYT
jgi:hypothetical protein